MLWSLIFVLWKLQQSNCSCTFPETGKWETSDHGMITFTSSTVFDFHSSFFGAQNYTCVANVGDNFMTRSTPFLLHGVFFEVYLCLRMIYVTANKYLYYLATDKNPMAGNERLKSAASNAPLGYSESCDRAVFEAGSYSMMIRTGYIQSELVKCPNEILAKWNYNITDTYGRTICSTISTLDICQNTALNFSTTKCSRNILHTAGKFMYCLHSTQITTSSFYITTYNADVTTPDENTTFRFSCLVIETNTNESLFASQYPRHCKPSQTATNVPSPGSLLSLSFQTNESALNTSNESLPRTQTSTATSQAHLIVAIAVPVIMLIVIAAILGYITWKWYKRTLNAKPLPDPKYIHGEIRNRRLNVQFEGVSTQYSNTTTNGFIKISENDVGSAMKHTAEIHNSSYSGPSSLSSLIISVQQTQLDTEDNCFNEFLSEVSDIDDVVSEISIKKDNQNRTDLDFHSIGVDTSELQTDRYQRKKGQKRKSERRFRLRRSRSSVGDSLLATRRTKDNSAKKSVVTFGTKNVVLGIKPPKYKKQRRMRGSVERRSTLKNISDNVELKEERTTTNQYKKTARKRHQNLKSPEHKRCGGLEPGKTSFEEDRFHIIFFSHYQEESGQN